MMFGSATVDPFCIERGFPAEWETGKRETSGGVVHVISTSRKFMTKSVCSPLPPPLLHSQLIRAVTWFSNVNIKTDIGQ
jgi:hypothetical protein